MSDKVIPLRIIENTRMNQWRWVVRDAKGESIGDPENFGITYYTEANYADVVHLAFNGIRDAEIEWEAKIPLMALFNFIFDDAERNRAFHEFVIEKAVLEVRQPTDE
jgi:hypothetical protein